MLKLAGLGVAFHAKPKVKAEVPPAPLSISPYNKLNGVRFPL
jgi:phosphoserine phosphatase